MNKGAKGGKNLQRSNNCPLEGIRIIDLGNFVAGPFAATLLADFGADVIKVEMPGSGSPMRQGNPLHEGKSLIFAVIERNKKGITVDLRKKEGQAIIRDLVKVSDVVVENFIPGTLESWNLGYEELKKVNPGIIMLRISGFGQTGPDRHKASFGFTAEVRGGYTYLCGYPDRPPLATPIALTDCVTGTFGALAVMLALYYRDTTWNGEGQCIDLALYEGLFRYLQTHPALYSILGIVQERQGEETTITAPRGVFQTKDGKWLAIVAAADGVFQRFCQVMEQPELSNGLFANQEGRGMYRSELHAITSAWVKEHTLKHILKVCRDASVPAEPVQSIADIFRDPLFRERENIVEVEDPGLGPVKMPNVIPKLSRTPGLVRRGAPRLGEHNDEIMGGLLGYSKEKIDGLRENGVMGVI